MPHNIAFHEWTAWQRTRESSPFPVKDGRLNQSAFPETWWSQKLLCMGESMRWNTKSKRRSR
jgi:hypothetical protein